MPKYAAAMRAATAERNKLLELAAEADNRGFTEARTVFDNPPWMISEPALIDAFEARAEQLAECAPWPRLSALALPSPAAAPSPQPSPIAPAASAASVSPQPPTPTRTKRTRPPAEPVPDGIEVVVLRGGIDGIPYPAGERVVLARDLAKQALRSGAVEIVEPRGAAA